MQTTKRRKRWSKSRVRSTRKLRWLLASLGASTGVIAGVLFLLSLMRHNHRMMQLAGVYVVLCAVFFVLQQGVYFREQWRKHGARKRSSKQKKA